ncbi:MAG TPA: HNH endonuclease signature motif containing protein, partial [Acidimicrobiales bacterium]|nr:HNH endonuclease signature motif containing protein [Acidimicrobiales bacterium]
RSIPPALRKKLLLRDRGCVFPGCPHQRWVDVHHIQLVDDHGPTDADNLVVLCGFHHHLIHNKHWRITGNPEHRTITFIRPDGTRLPTRPPLRRTA